MFILILIVGLLLTVISVALLFAVGADKGLSSPASITLIAIACLGVAVVIFSFTTAGGQLAINKFFASGQEANWLVIDNSGGETMRHWVLEDGYVKSAEGSDGWEFYDSKDNLCCVSGDAYVMRINEDYSSFMRDYKEKYNIPSEQNPLK